MRNKKFLGAASAALMIVVAVFLSGAGASAKSNFKTLHTFTGGKDNGVPLRGPILDSAGNLYGTSRGDALGCGEVFKLTPTPGGRWTKSVLHRFCSSDHYDGWDPNASMIFDDAGNLYGTTTWGGSHGSGTVFRLTHNSDESWTESVLYSFGADANDGVEPDSSLIFDGLGNLYGATQWGGGDACPYGCGIVFKLTPNTDGTWKEDVLVRFTGGKDGAHANALIFDSAGNLYGTTNGKTRRGNVYKLSQNSDGTWKEHVLHQFGAGTDGAGTDSALILDSTGNLYGTTAGGGGGCNSRGCGVVFKLTRDSDGNWKEDVLHRFTDVKQGYDPIAGLTFDSAGSLYGTTQLGGAYGYGVAFRMTPTPAGGWSYRVLHSFMNKPGAYPSASLIFDNAGNLYGSTLVSVFEITP